MSNRDILNKRIVVFLIAFILFSSIIYFYFGGFEQYHGQKVFRDRWYLCLQYLEEDRLYKEQAECYYPPLVYIITGFLYDFFGRNFITVMIILSLLLNVFIFLIMYEIIKKRINPGLFIPLILYGFVVLTQMLDLFLALGGLFFYSGFFYLFYSKSNYKEIISGFLFGLSILTYQYAFVMTGVVLTFYVISKVLKFDGYKPKINFKDIKYMDLFKIFFPIVILILFFSILYPGFLSYSYLAELYSIFIKSGMHNPVQAKFFISIFTDLINYILNNPISITHDYFTVLFYVIPWQSLVIIIISLISLYLLFRKKDIISLSLFIILLGVLFTSSEYYKIILAFPLFIIIFNEWLSEKSKTNLSKILKLIFIVSILVLLIYPNLKLIYLTHEFSGLAEEAGYPLSFLPEQSYILTSKDRTSWYDYKSDYKYDLLPPLNYDRYTGLVLENYGLVNLTGWRYREYNKQQSFLEKNIDKYDVIIYDVADQEHNFLYQHRKDLEKKGKLNNDLCWVGLISLEEEDPRSLFGISIGFKDETQCGSFAKDVVGYYIENLDKLCKKDMFVAKVFVNYILALQGIKLDMEKCENGGALYPLYATGKDVLGYDDIKIIFLLIIGISLILTTLRRRSTKKLLKLILLIVFTIILILSISVFLQNYDVEPYRDLNYKIMISYIVNSKEFSYGVCMFKEDKQISFSRVFCRTDEDCFKVLEDKMDIDDVRCSYGNLIKS